MQAAQEARAAQDQLATPEAQVNANQFYEGSFFCYTLRTSQRNCLP